MTGTCTGSLRLHATVGDGIACQSGDEADHDEAARPHEQSLLLGSSLLD